MANVISNFLVGLGFDYDNKGAKQFDSGMDQLVSKGKKLGVVLGGAFGFKTLTADFAQSKDQLGKFSDLMSVSANDVQAWGNALQSQGGSLDGVLSQIENIERKRASVQTGDTGWFGEAGKARIDPSLVTGAKDATEAILNLSTAFEKLTPQQRLNAGQALGFDKPMITLLSKGRSEVEQIVNHFKEVQPLTANMTKSAAEFNKQWVEAKANISGVANTISAELLPAVNDTLKLFNKGLGVGRDTFEGSPSQDLLGGGIGGAMHSLYSATDELTGGAMTKADQYLPSYQSVKKFMTFKPFEWMSERADSHTLYGKSDVLGTIKNSFIDDKQRPLTHVANTRPDEWGAMSQMRPNSSMFNYGDIMNAKPDQPVQPKINVNSPMQQNTRPIKNDITVKLDGAVIDRRISTVIERAADTALSQIETNIRS